jgi:hypothetical protein
MLEVKRFLDKITSLFRNKESILTVLGNPLVLCLGLTFLIILTEFIYLNNNIKINKGNTKLSLYMKMGLVVFGCAFVLVFGYTYVNKLLMKQKEQKTTSNDIFDRTTGGTNHNFVKVAPFNGGSHEHDEHHQHSKYEERGRSKHRHHSASVSSTPSYHSEDENDHKHQQRHQQHQNQQKIREYFVM